MAVLIVTHTKDHEAPVRVAAAIRARGGTPFRFDTDLFPTESRLSLREEVGQSPGELITPEGRLDLAAVEAIYYRRSAIADRIPKELEPQLRHPSVEESVRVVHGLLGGLDVFVLDPLDRIRRGENKPLQLRLAREVGLDVPRTLSTNDPEAVRAFAGRCPGGIITKMMAAFAVYDEGREMVVFTNPVSAEDLADLDGLDLCPMTFQERLDKRLELRVTVVGDRVMAAAIDSQRSDRAKNDWRRDGLAMIADWQAYALPADVAAKTVALMERLGLNYGAADFIVTPQGRHLFLEVNPAGEYTWLLQYPGLPIDEALADLLLGRARRR